MKKREERLEQYKIQKRKREIEEFFWICPYCKKNGINKEIIHESISSVFYNIEVHIRNKHPETNK